MFNNLTKRPRTHFSLYWRQVLVSRLAGPFHYNAGIDKVNVWKEMKYLKWIYPGLYRRWHVRAPELKVDDDRAIYNLPQKDDKCCFRLNIDCILDNAAIIRVSPTLCKLFNKERLLEAKEGSTQRGSVLHFTIGHGTYVAEKMFTTR